MTGCCGSSIIVFGALTTALVLGFCLSADCGATVGCGCFCSNGLFQNGVPLNMRLRGCLLVKVSSSDATTSLSDSTLTDAAAAALPVGRSVAENGSRSHDPDEC